MIKVIHFVRRLDRGGTEAFIFNNLEVLKSEGIHFDFLVTRNCIEEREQDVIKYGCQKFYVGSNKKNKFLNYIDVYKKTKNFLKNSDYKIIHFESNPPGINATASIIAAKRVGIPVRILHSHGAGNLRKKNSIFLSIVQNICRFINTKCCNIFLAPSSNAAKYGFGNAIVNKGKYYQIINGVTILNYKYNENVRNKTRIELGINTSFVIGSIGRLSAIKNFDLLIRIFSEVKKIYANVKLLIVGGEIQTEPNEKEKLSTLVSSLSMEDQVIFAGQKDNVFPFLCAMDMFVVTSETEALCIVALEAQLNGLYVVAKKSALPEEANINDAVLWIKEDGEITDWVKTIIKNIPKCAGRKFVDFTSEKIANVDIVKTSELLYKVYYENLQRCYTKRR